MWVFALPGLSNSMDGFDQGDTACCSCLASKTSSIGRANWAAQRPRFTTIRTATGACGTFWPSGVLSDASPKSPKSSSTASWHASHAAKPPGGRSPRKGPMSVKTIMRLRPCASLGLANGFCPARFHAVSAIHPDRLRHDLERLFRRSGL